MKDPANPQTIRSNLKINKMTEKILIIQFKYLGDAVFITPSIYALKQQNPDAEIHVLVAQDAARLFLHTRYIDKVWAFPRKRGKLNLLESWPIIIALRKEKFTKSVDFAGNDRGAILSLLIGAKDRLTGIRNPPKLLQKLAYTKKIDIKTLPISWVKRHLQLLFIGWNTPIPKHIDLTIGSDPALASLAKNILKDHTIICHLGTSQPKKEWPIHRWYELYQLATTSGYKLAFSTGPNERERQLLSDLKTLAPDIFELPQITDIELFLAVLNQAKLVIVGDTGPLHFASGLSVKVIGLFGTEDSVIHAAPIYDTNQLIFGTPCTCTGTLALANTCQSELSCMESITANQVLDSIKKQFNDF